MARFVIDVGAVFRPTGAEIEVADGHELSAPTLLRSQVIVRTARVAALAG
jgi:hypothetical protein